MFSQLQPKSPIRLIWPLQVIASKGQSESILEKQWVENQLLKSPRRDSDRNRVHTEEAMEVEATKVFPSLLTTSLKIGHRMEEALNSRFNLKVNGEQRREKNHLLQNRKRIICLGQ